MDKNYLVVLKCLVTNYRVKKINSFQKTVPNEKDRIALIAEDINELQKVGFEDVLSNFMYEIIAKNPKQVQH